MASVIYNRFKQGVLAGDYDLDNAAVDVKVALVTSTYTPDIDTHEDYADLTNEVANGNGYTTGGAVLANKAVTKDTTDNEGVFDADNVTWSNSTITARGAVVYVDTGTDSTSLLIAYFDFGEDKVSSAGDFIIQWATEGIINIG
jgi:hypothetical protein